MSTSIRLRPVLQVLRRSHDAVQVGDGTAEGLVLEGLTPTERDFIESLAGGAPIRMSVAPPRARELVTMLDAHGMLDQVRPRPRRTHTPCIAVAGAPRLTEGLQRALVDAGYHLAASEDSAATPRRRAASPAQSPEPSPVNLAVLIGNHVIPHHMSRTWSDQGVPLLPVVVDGHHISLGPLISPDGPCLHCLDLVRCDHDPAWPVMLAQLSAQAHLDASESRSHALKASVAIALTLLDIERHTQSPPARTDVTHRLDANPSHPNADPSGRRAAAVAVSTTWKLPELTATRHIWHIHPRCPGHHAPATTAAQPR